MYAAPAPGASRTDDDDFNSRYFRLVFVSTESSKIAGINCSLSKYNFRKNWSETIWNPGDIKRFKNKPFLEKSKEISKKSSNKLFCYGKRKMFPPLSVFMDVYLSIKYVELLFHYFTTLGQER